MGVAVGLMALWSYRYLQARLGIFDVEMESATLEMANQLSRFNGPIPRSGPATLWPHMAMPDLGSERRFRNRALCVSGVALCVAWCLEFIRFLNTGFYAVPSVARAAAVDVLFYFCACCFPAQLIWSRLLKRRPGGLALVASLLALIWCAAAI
jgi:hypothetical protein